ncbi:MAG: pseudouridine-5'-phosphate glycosidase [Candidatus Cloacimonetes bacterium]|nr:pseudouridine-5'-phosphate glycosidase [Candidatus Cloacimonadota bacterium]MDD2422865.1 pseudouridine-5'-phosphate glycosidase [Candidatus Cloacimonadota bacterium]MDD3562224.1 pseudouridine-5'-phosphate glycosidase [Candidatus Cloacimonadota bacterium]MDD4276348.1 pseudouridine-5'-phosphate glycosidase [Candidatus Cloacimonadota bacterium]
MKAFPLKISSKVQYAIDLGKPVLALESTVITHGLPYPQNIEFLADIEALAEQQGVVPATICVLNGECLIGLEPADIEVLQDKMQRKDELQKLTLRDLGLALAQKQSGGTTVSATMALAEKAGIRVFVTGGIGGVHRGWQESRDVSLDLKALATIPVIVVCAGCKAILDIGATLEALETEGVPVYAWQTAEFPSFYSRESGHKVARIDSAQDLAQAFKLMSGLGSLHSGMLIACPIPATDEIPHSEIEPYIQLALKAANHLSGKAITPYLLDHLAKSTEGRSVSANLALLKNNLRLGALIAKEMT